MNKYKKLALNTGIFAIGSFGAKILVLLLTRLYAHNISDVKSGIKELLEPLHCCSFSLYSHLRFRNI